MPAGIMEYDSMFSVREMPWHRLGAVLDEYPSSIEDALIKSGLEWKVDQEDIYVGGQYEYVDDFKANIRRDTRQVLGVVSSDYKVVQNSEAFEFMDALIGSELHFETAGSLYNGKRVWVLARLPEHVEIGGDEVSTYVFVANSHDGSMSVTAAVTPVRIVCANTLGLALSKSERDAKRTYKFRHTGNLDVKFAEARQVLGMTVNYEEQFKALGDKLAQERFSDSQFEKVAMNLVGLPDDELGDRAKTNRENIVETLTSIWNGDGPDGDTTGNSPGTKWAAVNAIGEYSDWGRRYTKRTDQMARSFESSDIKQRGLELVLAAE